jgi:phage terminase large subunit-like protein
MDYWFDKKAAARAVNFIERYVLHTEGAKAGEPFLLEKWQKEIVSDLFGWKRQDGTRRYRKSYIQVGRGNGKSTFVTALCLVAMFVDNEPAAFIAYAALNREQANMIGWKMMSETIEANPELSKLVKILKSVKTIEYRPIKNNEYSGLSIFKTVSRDSGGLHGLNCHIAVVDEYHTHPDSQVLDTLATSMLKT